MIEIIASISLFSGNDGTLSDAIINNTPNNVSRDINQILGSQGNSTPPFLLGISKLGDRAYLVENSTSFIGTEYANNNGEFETPYQLVVTGTNINSITIAFDTQNNRHPQKIQINGTNYFDDDAIFTISNLNNLSELNIVVDDWNAAGYPLIIEGIYVSITLDINYKNLNNIDRSLFDRADTSMPSYGIVSNNGNITFSDFSGEIADYASAKMLKSGLPVNISIRNTLANSNTKSIGRYFTSTWNYDNDNRQVSVGITDGLQELQDIQFPQMWGNFSYELITFASYYNMFKNYAPSNLNFASIDELDEATQNHLNNCYLGDRYFVRSGSLWNQFQKLCEAAHLHLYRNNEGKSVVKYIGGN